MNTVAEPTQTIDDLLQANEQTLCLQVRHLGRRDYDSVWQGMKLYTDHRDKFSQDELWVVEHNPVYTQGQAGKAEHILNPGNIPIIQVDRGGQVTYHGPGQLVIYCLIDIRRRGIGVRTLVTKIETAIINLLASLNIEAHSRLDAPGVYVGDAKVASLGLRIRKGCSFHGLALNVTNDLSPFLGINPCGYANMAVTSLKELGADLSLEQASARLVGCISSLL